MIVEFEMFDARRDVLSVIVEYEMFDARRDVLTVSPNPVPLAQFTSILTSVQSRRIPRDS